MTTVHASAVLVGAKAVLIRGPSGAGKSRLAFNLIECGRTGVLPFARLVGDDRVRLEARDDRLLVYPADELAGLIEVRGLGIRRLVYERAAVVGWVIDLGLPGGPRLPAPEDAAVAIAGIALPRLAVAAPETALAILPALLRTQPAGD